MTKTGSHLHAPTNRTAPDFPCRGRRGQAIIFFIMVLVILVFVVLWNYDLHKILYVKSISQNAGDSAALAAARWQGITLNLIGDLNILHAMALADNNPTMAASCTSIQARLCYTGPMIALVAAQQAAKNNGIYVSSAFSGMMLAHSIKVRDDYPSMTAPDGTMLFPEPYPNAWKEYAAMLELVANDGVAAGPDNMRLYGDYAGGHTLLRVDFYEAIAGKSWCWFYNNEPDLLVDYQNFFPCWWPALPEIPHAEYMNSEIFGLGLMKETSPLSHYCDDNTVSNQAVLRGIAGTINSNAMEAVETWYCYDTLWSPWSVMAVTGPDPFPLTGALKPQFDYVGADAVTRVETHTTRLSPAHKGASSSNDITWTAAAKPFGYLNTTDTPHSYGLVLPAFHEVHLIPVDSSTAPSGGGYNLGWREHIEQHLPEYMVNGPKPSSCWYCKQLVVWEGEPFRQEGVDWLAVNSAKCNVGGGGGGGGPGGGTHHGH